MRRFTPVPYDAQDLVGPDGYRAVMDLYRRAHLLRWRSFSVTASALATAWDCSTRRVWMILGLLEAEGWLEVKRGTNRAPSLVTVFDPSVSDEPEGAEDDESANHKVNRKGNCKVNRNSQGQSVVLDECESQSDSQTDSQTVLTLSELELEPEPEQEEHRLIRAPLLLTPAVATKDDDWTRLAKRYAARPHCSMPRDRKKGIGLHIGRLLSAIGIDSALLVLEWWERGPDRAQYLRDQKHGIDTVSRKAEEYLVMAKEWKATDRGQVVPETREQRKARERAEDDAAQAAHRERLARAREARNGG